MKLSKNDINSSKDKLVIEVPVIIEPEPRTKPAVPSALIAKLYISHNDTADEYYIFELEYGQPLHEYSKETLIKLNKKIPLEDYPIFSGVKLSENKKHIDLHTVPKLKDRSFLGDHKK